MGLFSKIKDMFYYEEEVVDEKVELPKKEEPKVEEVDDEEDEVLTERELFKSEPTFKFPIMFEEQEFSNKESLNVLELEKEGKLKTEEKVHSFKPSPIISPIYGVLDKDYQREDVEVKTPEKTEAVTFESVRKKAFGSLQDELEKTMSDEPLEKKIKQFEDFDLKLDDTEVSLDVTKITIGDAEENFEDYGLSYDTDKIKKEKKETVTEDTEELFDMIDSMYEEGDDN